ncbi:MAG: T9SS type A sorting domain-containing protein [Flavobacteriales bacterium]
MRALKVFITVGFCGFLTNIYSLGIIGGDLTYSYVSGNTYQVTIGLYSDSLLTAVEVEFGDGSNDTVPITQSMIQIGKYYGSFSVAHTYPGAGTYILTIGTINWTSSILNIPNSQNELFELTGQIKISPFFTGNSSVSFGSSQLNVNYAGGFYYHDLQISNPDSDSLAFSFASIPATGYLFPSQMGGTETISTAGILQTSMSINGLFALAINITEIREMGPGQYFDVGSVMRIITIDGTFTSVSENEKQTWVVYPNPSSGLVYLPDGNSTYDVLVHDMQGKIYIQQNRVKNQLDVNALAAGNYIMRLLNTSTGEWCSATFTKH